MKTIKSFAFAGIFYLFFFVSVTALHAETNLIYMNGINNTLEQAQRTKNIIRDVLESSESYIGEQKKTFDIKIVWNPIGFYGTEQGRIGHVGHDLIELFLLKTAEEHFFQDFLKILVPFNMSQPLDQEAAYRVTEYLTDMIPEDTCISTTNNHMEYTKRAVYKLISEIINTGPSVVIAHSQGNLLANLAYAYLGSFYGNDTKNMVRIVNIANTSAFSVNKLNFTHEGDAALQSLETLPSLMSCLRTTPFCNNSDCNFFIPYATFGEPTTDIPDQGIVDKFLDHSIVETYLSTANVPVAIDQDVTFTPGAERFRDRFVDFVYAAAESFFQEPSSPCGAYVASGVWKEFDCYNLAAIGKNTNDDPFTPSWRLIGGYWQWGRKGPEPSDWHETNTEHFAHGPTGPSAGEANEFDISGWDNSYALDGAWSDSYKTANDPCPAGYRVPSNSLWEGVLGNNSQSTVGTWSSHSSDHTNYSAARFFGSDLMLPAAGYRPRYRYYNVSGALYDRGRYGYYWSSLETGISLAWSLHFSSGSAVSKTFNRRNGFSVRCVAEDSTSLKLDKTHITLKAGESETVIIRGGTGYYTASSDNEQVAILQVLDDSVVIYTISTGTATITVEDTGGSSATITIAVISSICGAYVAPDVWKEFDCYNLAAIGKTTGDDPFTPSWHLIGGYWQWGRKGPDPSHWYDTNTPNFAHGPGPLVSDNDGVIGGWDQTDAPDGAWSDSYKTTNDPCPVGYRVPTKSQWDGVRNNNTQSTVGTWTNSATNYSSARFFGSNLMLPAAGYRYYKSGALGSRGSHGGYWSSSHFPRNYDAWYLRFSSGSTGTYLYSRRDGFSVRCISDSITKPEYSGMTQSYDDGNYYIAFAITGDSISSIDVLDGPNIVSTWDNHASLSVRPEPGDTYTIRINYTDGTSQETSYIVEGVNDHPAKIVSPQDFDIIDTTQPTIEWQQLTGISYGYRIKIHKIEGDQETTIWMSDDIDPLDSSCVFNFDNTASEALQPGGTYQLHLHSYDENGNQATSTIIFIIFDNVNPTDGCGAYIAPDVWKEFDCYNLAAIGKTTYDDPFIPSWRLIGGYWQWGRKGPEPNDWYDTNTPNFAHGPTGLGGTETNSEYISGWDQTDAHDGAWSDSHKTANDPCPVGYRVPTKSQWEGVVNNNTQSSVGTWSIDIYDHTNYSAARFFGDTLLLPAAGQRDIYAGRLSYLGSSGNYWSSSDDPGTDAWFTGTDAWFLTFLNSHHLEIADISYYTRHIGFSVRCIAEEQKQVIEVDKTVVTILPGDMETVIFLNGAGDYIVSSDNEQVAMVKVFDDSVEITGISTGTATVTVEDSGGSTAIITVTVISQDSCGAYVASGVWKEFDCYNLAAIGKETGADPFTPSWELIGGYWQWGRKGPDPSVWHFTNTPNFAHGPTGQHGGQIAGQTNEGEISGWDTTYAADGAWSDSYKTINDPCPVGYRVPTKSQWDGVRNNNTHNIVGAWSIDYYDHTNYSPAYFYGSYLMLPAAGGRDRYTGGLGARGHHGVYWSSSENSSGYEAWRLGFLNGNEVTNDYSSCLVGMSVRCAAE